MAHEHAFALGYNKTELQKLHEISPPLFGMYASDLKTIWHGEVERIVSGDLRVLRDGLPWVEFIFPVLTVDEIGLLRSTFFSNGELSVPVTVRTLNFETETYQRFNAMMRWPDLTDRHLGAYRDVVLVVEHMESLESEPPPPSGDSGFDAGFDEGFGA